jgi:hypothetical protein
MTTLKGHPGSVRGCKKRLRGLLYPVRLGQVRIAIISSIIQKMKEEGQELAYG